MNKETFNLLIRLRNDNHNSIYGWGEPGYEGPSATEVATHLERLLSLIITDAAFCICELSGDPILEEKDHCEICPHKHPPQE